MCGDVNDLDSLCRWQVQVFVYCASRISAHLRCTQCWVLLHLINVCFIVCHRHHKSRCVLVGPGLISTSAAFAGAGVVNSVCTDGVHPQQFHREFHRDILRNHKFNFVACIMYTCIHVSINSYSVSMLTCSISTLRDLCVGIVVVLCLDQPIY